ncbi:DUF948 domain-containing protein [Allobacillus sp. SKP8-2]|uniref:DUF948 domain-containing protein n=1 Tax=Allobacillus saliphilus TaxID=2912308 RepID=A0A941HTG0_9BACI|nr:DUF948 domain-containing protein [Allobacillus saliphilus]MBR7553750.1 DUF948 domain-containing protein [Allobacillus saliphilus]
MEGVFVVNLLHIAALIAAVAFLVLVIFLAKTLMSVSKTLDNVSTTLESVEKQMQGISEETTLLLQKTNYLADDISEKTAKTTVLFDGIKGIGQTVNEFNHSLQQLSREVQQQAGEQAPQASQAMKWGEAAIHLWKSYKGKK